MLSDLGTDDEDENTISLSLDSAGVMRAPSVFEAALPYLEGMDPQRAAAVRLALRQLSLFEQDRVILAMPVIQMVD